MSEEWVDEEKLELWEVRQYGERAERMTPLTRTSTGKLPPRAAPAGSAPAVAAAAAAAPAPAPANAAELKDRLEQQLREQRAAHHQKRAQEMAQGTSAFE